MNNIVETTALWICPSMCGCKLHITAKWNRSDLIVENDVTISYHHPWSAPGFSKYGQKRTTITSIEIANKCADHDTWDQSLLVDPLTYRRGYMDTPTSPTPAEFLYLNLQRYKARGGKLFACDCKVCFACDLTDKSEKAIKHPKTIKSDCHKSDDDSHTQALGENKLVTDTLKELSKVPQLQSPVYALDKKTGNVTFENEFDSSLVSWSFDANRELVIDIPKLTANEKALIDLGKVSPKIKFK